MRGAESTTGRKTIFRPARHLKNHESRTNGLAEMAGLAGPGSSEPRTAREDTTARALSPGQRGDLCIRGKLIRRSANIG